MTPYQYYQQLVRHDGYQPDPQQEAAMRLLDDLYLELIDEDRQPGMLGKMLGRKPRALQGVYFYGTTGRGKTWLMDSFYACLDFPNKHRLHFHRFMLEIHHDLSELEKTADPLKAVAKQWAKKYQLICLDEFHVSDIGDAMILAGLLQALFDEGLTLVTTSNIPIEELYKNGLQRERFVPAIKLLQEHTKELSLGDGNDYRIGMLKNSETYHVINGTDGHLILQEQFRNLANVPAKTHRDLLINQRKFHYMAWANEYIWFTFDELCSKPRSASDYMDIAKSFHTLFISGIPVFSEEKDDAAKRFVHLIDALYDNKVKLIATAEAPANDIYQGKLVKFEFDRTVSRLSEMASESYLCLEHGAVE